MCFSPIVSQLSLGHETSSSLSNAASDSPLKRVYICSNKLSTKGKEYRPSKEGDWCPGIGVGLLQEKARRVVTTVSLARRSQETEICEICTRLQMGGGCVKVSRSLNGTQNLQLVLVFLVYSLLY